MAVSNSEGALLGWLRRLAPGLGLTVVLVALGLWQVPFRQEAALSSTAAPAGAEGPLAAGYPSSAEADPMLEAVGERESQPAPIVDEAPPQAAELFAAEPPLDAAPDVALAGLPNPRDGWVIPSAADPEVGDQEPERAGEVSLTASDRPVARSATEGSDGSRSPVAPSPPLVNHVVTPGDTLSAIAARFEVNIESIRLANNLGPDSVLRIGQSLLVPTPNGPVHVVAPGDTLSEIAAGYGVDLRTVASANQLDGDLLTPGQRLLIPGGVRPSTPTTAAAARRPAATPGALAALTTAPSARRTARVPSPAPTPTPAARHR
jgi:LysM repeat protein